MNENHYQFFPDDCPVSSTKSKRIGDKCYSLGPTRLDIYDAQLFCMSLCGKLAEPNLSQNDIKALYDGFTTQFADEIVISSYRNTNFCFVVDSYIFTFLTMLPFSFVDS